MNDILQLIYNCKIKTCMLQYLNMAHFSSDQFQSCLGKLILMALAYQYYPLLSFGYKGGHESSVFYVFYLVLSNVSLVPSRSLSCCSKTLLSPFELVYPV